MVNDIINTDDFTAICDKTLQKAAVTELIDAIQPVEPKCTTPQPRYPSAKGPSAPMQYSLTTPRSTNTQRPTTYYPLGSRRPKLTDAEREVLVANNSCFKCRRVNAGHISYDCPKGRRASSTTSIKREEVSIVDGYIVRRLSPEQDVESPPYYCSVPTIVVPT